MSSKRDYAALWTYFLLLGLFCSIYKIYKRVYLFQERFEVLKLQHFKLVSEAYSEPSQTSEMELFAESR